MKASGNGLARQRMANLGFLFVGLGAAVALGAPASAQEATPQVVAAGLEAWEAGACQTCHGQFAQGGEGGEQPAGPSLRRTRLERDALVETVSCGRPGTGMPAMLIGAYTSVPCYGLPVSARPPDDVVTMEALEPEQI